MIFVNRWSQLTITAIDHNVLTSVSNLARIMFDWNRIEPNWTNALSLCDFLLIIFQWFWLEEIRWRRRPGVCLCVCAYRRCLRGALIVFIQFNVLAAGNRHSHFILFDEYLRSLTRDPIRLQRMQCDQTWKEIRCRKWVNAEEQTEKSEAKIDLILMRGLKLKRDTRRMFASLLCSYFMDDSMIFGAHSGTAYTHTLCTIF